MVNKITLAGVLIVFLSLGIDAQVLISEGFEGAPSSHIWKNASGNTSRFLPNSAIFHSGSYSVRNEYVNNSSDTLFHSGVLDLTTTTSPQLIFWHICKLLEFSDEGQVYISTDSGVTYTALPASSYLGTSSGTDGYVSSGYFNEMSYPIWSSVTSPILNSWWRRESFDLSAYTSFDKVKIIFVLASDFFGATEGWYLDDISVENVTCPNVTSISDFGTSSDTTTITWLASSSDSLWEVQYGISGFSVGTGTLSGFVSTDTVGVGSLFSNTTYEIYVRNICKAGDTSSWYGPHSFTTLCSAFVPPYTEDFSLMATSNSLPTCWEEAQGMLIVNSTLTNQPHQVWGSKAFANVTGGSKAAVIQFGGFGFGGGYDWLISPSFDLGMGAGPYQVEFEMAFTDMNNPTISSSGITGSDKIALLISEDNGVTWSDTNILALWDSSTLPPSHTGEFVARNITTAGYSGQVKFAFYTKSNSTFDMDELFIDNFSVVPVPTCPRPLQLTFDSATLTTAYLSWTNGAADLSWQFEYGSLGYTQGSGTPINSASNPAQITGLNPGTCYDVYLRSICTVGDSSAWIGPLTFCTECAAVSDLCEDFEGIVSGLPICWKQMVSTSGSSRIQVNTFGGNSAPGAIEMNSGNDSTSTIMLVSPEMTGLTAGTHRAIFWWKNLSLTLVSDTVVIGTISDPTNISTFTPWDTLNIHSPSYIEYKIPFDTYTGTDTRIAFLYEPTAKQRAISMDDFCFEAIPSCEKASAIQLLNAGQDSNSLNVGWNTNASHASYMLAYGPSGFNPVTQPTGGDTIVSTANFASILGLNPITEYCVWLKAVCSNGDTSLWSGPFCGETGCPSSLAIPYFQDFSGYASSFPEDIFPACWVEGQGKYTAGVSPTTQSSYWTAGGFGNVGTTGAAIMDSWNTQTNEWIISPSIDLGASAAGRHIRIEYDVSATKRIGNTAAIFGQDDSLVFMISRNNGASWDNAGILNVFDRLNNPASAGDHIVLDLPNEMGMVKFAFYAVSKYENSDVVVQIDNFRVYDSTFTSLTEIQELDDFKVYPNPNSGEFVVENQGSSIKSSVVLLDIQGRAVYKETYFFNANGRKVIDVNSLKAGVYVLLIQSEGELEQHRIIINN